MVVIWLIMLYSSEANINCVDPGCSSCLAGYLYNSISCLPMCPTSYSPTGNVCWLSSQLNLFTLYFFEFTTFGVSQIGDFSGPTAFGNPSQTSGIPTKNQGFYFSGSGSLTSLVSWVLAPDITFSFLYMLTGDGSILTVRDGLTTVMGISQITGSLTFSLLLTDQTLSVESSKSINYAVNSGWVSFSIIVAQMSSFVTMTAFNMKYTFNLEEFRHITSTLEYTIGGNPSFSGFIYTMSLYNTQVPGIDGILPIYSADYNMIIDSSGTHRCSISCDEWPACIEFPSCILCLLDVACQSCSGYGLYDCITCASGVYDPECGVIGVNCTSGGLFSCTSCSSGILIDGLCLPNQPYLYDQDTPGSEVISLSFDTFTASYGGLFTSGANPSTYSPENPEFDDPIALKNRGLYFSGDAFLSTTIPIPLNYKFTIAFWSLSDSLASVYQSSYLNVYSSTCANLTLSSYRDSKTVNSGECFSSKSQWAFSCLVVKFSYVTTTISTFVNQVSSTSASIDGYAFYDIISPIIYIGKRFSGYIFSLTIWQTASVDTTSFYDVCSGGGGSCLWECAWLEYYNAYTAQFMLCEPDCVYGCGTWGTCSQCLYADCASCTNFNSACGESPSVNKCLSGYTITNTGKCCHNNCADCNKASDVSCLACVAGYFLLGFECVASCPLGFSIQVNNCVATSNPYISLSLDVIKNQVYDSASGILFGTGTDSSFFPSDIGNDPIPVAQRGYYFKSGSLMTSAAFDMSYNFTIIFYIKLANSGQFFTKDTLSVNYDTSSYINAGFNSHVLNSLILSGGLGWTVLGISVWKDFDQIQSTQIQFTSNSGSPITSTTSIYFSTTTNVVLSATNTLTYFLWSLTIYSSIEDASGLQIQTCVPPAITSCMSSCSLTSYLDSTGCIPCSTSCTESVCRRGTDCSLCVSVLCTACSDYDHCTSCVANAQLNAAVVCECTTGYYWDPTALACVMCKTLCTACTDCNTCTSCTANAQIDSSSACKCIVHYYWYGLICSICDPVCLDCTGPSAGECVCGANSYQSTNGCKCNPGYYMLNFNCEICNEVCIDCTGPGAENCLCGDFSFQDGKGCECYSGYAKVGKVCKACDLACLSCFGEEFYQCLTCTGYLLESVCLNLCPVGYAVIGNTCVLEDDVIVRYIFDTVSRVFEDLVYGLVATSGEGSGLYPSLDNTDVIPAYQRGIYFTGSGSYLRFPYSNHDILLLSLRFFIAIWINPISPTSPLLHKDFYPQILLSLRIDNLYITTSIEVDNRQHQYQSINPLHSQQWNHMLFAVDYTSYTELKYYINTYESTGLYISDAPYTDIINSLFLMGTDSASLEFFNGFIYSLEIYITNPLVSRLATLSNCDSCSVCPASEICIPNCNIHEFYNNTILECVQCNADCPYGCRNQMNCTLCIDPNCASCSTYALDSCLECAANYEIINNSCQICNSSAYYNPVSKSCRICPELCLNCISLEKCQTCDGNSHLTSKNQCECDLGYFLNITECQRNAFYAFISIDSNNIVRLTFTENLKDELQVSNIQVKVSGNAQDFTLHKIDNSTYEISVSFSNSISPGDKAEVRFVGEILSADMSALVTIDVNIELFPSPTDSVAAQVNQAINYAQIALIAGMSAVVGSTCISANPISFFNLLNNIDIYIYTSLFQENIDEVLIGFLQTLSPNSWLPNIFSYLVDQNEGNQLNQRFNNLGNSTNLLLVNSGPTLGILILLLIVLIIAILSYNTINPWLKRQIMKVISSYQFKVFLRFFIQSFLELSCNSLIGIYFSTLSNSTQVIDFSICIAVAVIYI